MSYPHVHASASVDDAVAMLDTRIPLLHSERVYIVQTLWDTAFQEGAQQGRQAGTEAERWKLAKIAAGLAAHPSVHLTVDQVVNALKVIANEPDAGQEAAKNGTRGEYMDTTRAIREALTEKAKEHAIL